MGNSGVNTKGHRQAQTDQSRSSEVAVTLYEKSFNDEDRYAAKQ